MSVRSQRSFDPEAEDSDNDHESLTEKSFDPESGAGANRSFSERSFDPECSMLDDENGSYDASEASYDPDADLARRRSSASIKSEKSFDPEQNNDQDLSGFEDGSRPIPKTISADVADRAITSIRNVAAQELERLRSEVDSLKTALESTEHRYSIYHLCRCMPQ
jgi:hypothetical protein